MFSIVSILKTITYLIVNPPNCCTAVFNCPFCISFILPHCHCSLLSPHVDCSCLCRYSLEWHSESDSCFDIDTVEGTISTNEYLDRETVVWHNITVVATKVSKYSTTSTQCTQKKGYTVKRLMCLAIFIFII